MPTKLIEVSLPLTEINEACVTEKKLRSGVPSNIHAWWARRPFVAARAILFAQLVDDPSAHPDEFPTPETIEAERERLFTVLRALLDPKGPSKTVLAQARAEIVRCVGDQVEVSDPFAGGGSIPVEAQRLGLRVRSTDLNPVAVLLNRVFLEQMHTGLERPPAHPQPDRLTAISEASGLDGLAQDVVHYGKRLRDKATETLGKHYPEVADASGRSYPVISWIWARTVPCPNPACRRTAPLLSSFWLSKKAGRPRWLVPHVSEPGGLIQFTVEGSGGGPDQSGSKTGRGVRFRCLGCDQPISEEHIRASGCNSDMGQQLVAVAALGDRKRLYFAASESQVSAAQVEVSIPADLEAELVHNPRAIAPPGYGLNDHASLFTSRQLLSLLTFTGLLPGINAEVAEDSGGDIRYAELVTTILGLSVSKLADHSNSFCWWEPPSECPRNMFARQAIPMVWDFAEGNPLGESSGSFMTIVENAARAIRAPLMSYDRKTVGEVRQANAATCDYPEEVVVATDPPYFDNIGYADVADFFYVWLRQGLQTIHSDLFETLLTPKTEELVVAPYRFKGGKKEAVAKFEDGFRQVFGRIRARHHPGIPMTVFYAYKQEDSEVGDQAGASGAGATGWEKLLQGMVDAGLQVTGTWPIRTEMASRLVGRGTNALASSVVLACRPRSEDAGVTDRQGFIRHLRRELVSKLAELHAGGIQPVDMAQASIGPGMAVFTSYSRVVEAGDQSMSVGTALQVINQVLDELQSEQEGDLDPYTRWAVTWFDQFGMNAGDFGDAQNIATARGTAMNAVERSGIVDSRAGRVRLLDRSEYPDDWDPTTDKTLTVWEICQHIIRRLDGDGGVPAAAELLRQSGGLAESARDLSYRLYEIANRRGWAEEARGYNNMATEWPGLVAAAAQSPSDSTTLF